MFMRQLFTVTILPHTLCQVLMFGILLRENLPIIYRFAWLSSSYDPWLSRILLTTGILCIDRVRCLPVNHLWSTHTSLQKESLSRAELGSGVSRLHTESLEFSGGTFTETVLFHINCWLLRYFCRHYVMVLCWKHQMTSSWQKANRHLQNENMVRLCRHILSAQFILPRIFNP